MASSPEGKVMDYSSTQCGSCQSNVPTKYCTDCKMPLCSMCSNIHKNIPATQGHQISDLQESIKDTKTKAQQTKCATHGAELLTHLCKDCVQLLCTSCKCEHVGHELLPLSDDPKVYHKICGKHIQQLFEDLHEIEELKAVLEGHITTYDEALVVVDTWEQDLIKMIKEKTVKLRQKIKQMKDEKFKLLGEKVKGLMGKLKEIDESITKLNDIRKSMDTGILANELSKSQEVIRKLESYKSELGPLHPALSVDKVLPHGDTIHNIDCDLSLVFSMDYAAGPQRSKGPQPVAEWVFTSTNGGSDISTYGENPVTLKNVKYGPGPNGRPDTAVILPSKGQSIIVMNPNHRLRFKNTMTYFTHIYIEGTNGGYPFAYDAGATTSIECGTRTYISGRTGEFNVWNIGFSLYIDKVVVTQKTWIKIAVVMDSSRVSVYVDGKHVKTERKPVDLSKTNVGHIHMGCGPGIDGLQGKMSCAKFFDVALSENEIQNLP